MYDFHLNVVSLLRLLPKVVLASGEVVTELDAPIQFVPEVFNRVHVRGLSTPW